MTRWVVVGGGTAGCVVAAHLAAGRPGDEVLMLEAGPEHAPSTPADGDTGPYLEDPARVAAVDVGGRSYVHGFGVGGGSLVNAGVVVGDPAAYRHRLPLEPATPIGPLGTALLAADARAAPALLVRRAGHRVTASEAYLGTPPRNLTVRAGTPVVRVAFEARRAVGVITATGQHVAADRVVVCAGAIGTPALLLRSGVDAPGVGAGLQDHVGVSLALDLPGAPVDPLAPTIAVTAEHGDHQVLAIERSPATADLAVLLGGWLAVRGVGAVSLPDPDGPPHVTFAGVTDPADRRGVSAAAAALVRLADHPRLRELAAAIYVDTAGTTLDQLRANGDDAVQKWAASAPSPYHHAAGSCRLNVVTDDAGWVRGYAGLAVSDASTLPGVPRRNVFLAVVDLAERLSAGWARTDRV